MPRKPKTKTAGQQALKEKQIADSHREDSHLIARALKGDQFAYRRLRQKYYEAVFRLVYKMVREKRDVEDLTQEAFIKAFQSLASFNHEFAFSTWLYRIATNNCIDYIRKKKLQTLSIDKPIEGDEDEYSMEIPDSTYEPDRVLIEHQRKKLIEDAIASLPEKYQIVIRMRHMEDKDYQEIAIALKLPLGTVKAHIFRARELLYKQLKNKLRHY